MTRIKKTFCWVSGLLLGKLLWGWLGKEPDHLANSRAKALDDLLHKSGYVPTHRYKREGGNCVYTNGHVDKAAFLEAVKVMAGSDIPEDARGALDLEDVEHIRFRPLSPSEARGSGLTWGVMQTEEGGYPVTAVKL